MRRLLTILVALALSPVIASDAVYTWNPSPGAASYSLYLGTAPGVYGPPVTTPAITHTFPGGSMAQNATNYLGLSASNLAGESATVEIVGWPRPVIFSAVPVPQTDFIRLTILGTNFSPGIDTAAIDLPGMEILSATRVDAGQIIVDYTVTPETPSGPAALTVSNEWVGAGFVKSVQSDVTLVPELIPPVPVPLDIF